jgi:hypothetical protein
VPVRAQWQMKRCRASVLFMVDGVLCSQNEAQVDGDTVHTDGLIGSRSRLIGDGAGEQRRIAVRN